jgi:hypothetical protein
VEGLVEVVQNRKAEGKLVNNTVGYQVVLGRLSEHKPSHYVLIRYSIIDI